MQEFKVCTKCNKDKPYSEFHKKKANKTGVSSNCKVCANKVSNLSKAKNPEYYKEIRELWKINNKERHDFLRQRWAEENRERSNEIKINWIKRNPSKVCYFSSNRRAMKKNAEVNWANQFFMEEVYSFARLRTKLFDFKWEVDHIVPLQSDLVCGLHCEQNLQVIPRKENRIKSNKNWPGMP